MLPSMSSRASHPTPRARATRRPAVTAAPVARPARCVRSTPRQKPPRTKADAHASAPSASGNAQRLLRPKRSEPSRTRWARARPGSAAEPGLADPPRSVSRPTPQLRGFPDTYQPPFYRGCVSDELANAALDCGLRLGESPRTRSPRYSPRASLLWAEGTSAPASQIRESDSPTSPIHGPEGRRGAGAGTAHTWHGC